MSYIYGWVKNLVCFYILLTVVLHLLPKENYQKYVRFFSGMLLTILVVSPLLSLMGNEEILRQKISQAGFFQELDNLKLDTEHLETVQKEAYLREYERALEMDVGRMAEQKQLLASQIRVRLSGEYQVESIEMKVSFPKEAGTLARRAANAGGRDAPEVNELKQELMEFYRLGENQISIEMV